MATITRTFFIETDEFFPSEIHKKLRDISIRHGHCKGLQGIVYEIGGGKAIRYHLTSVEILTHNHQDNYEIKSELEEFLSIKLSEPN